MDTKKKRAMGILAKINDIEKVGKNHYRVRSQTEPEKKYDVKVTPGEIWACSCPDFHYRLSRCDDKHCKHIVSCMELRDAIDEKCGIKKDGIAMICKECDSSSIVKDGFRDLVQGKRRRYKCKQCGYRFSPSEPGFAKTSKDPHVIKEALDLVFSDGMSYRKIARHLGRQDVSVSHVAILGWVKKYMEIVQAYVSTLAPELGDVLSTDEMVLKVRKVEKRSKGFYRWLWGTIDPKTRFALATEVTKRRTTEDAKKVIRKSRDGTSSQTNYVITDYLASYNEAIIEELGDKVAHVKTKSLEDGFSNRTIERYWNEVREIIKTKRGLDNEESAARFMEFYKIYRNFVRPHMGLDGLTPAEAAKIYLDLGPDKLGGLIKLAFEHQRPGVHRLGPKRLAKVDVSNDGSSITVRAKRWLEREMWVEINDILQQGGFSWMPNGKESCWTKTNAGAA